MADWRTNLQTQCILTDDSLEVSLLTEWPQDWTENLFTADISQTCNWLSQGQDLHIFTRWSKDLEQSPPGAFWNNLIYSLFLDSSITTLSQRFGHWPWWQQIISEPLLNNGTGWLWVTFMVPFTKVVAHAADPFLRPAQYNNTVIVLNRAFIPVKRLISSSISSHAYGYLIKKIIFNTSK